MLSVHQHWDPLKLCIVGRCYPPEFFSFIENSRVRSAFERIAGETEEDYQKLIDLLRKFDVEVLRPDLPDTIPMMNKKRYRKPPTFPRDHGGMFGGVFYFNHREVGYEKILERVRQTNIVVHSETVNTSLITRVGVDLYIGTESNKESDWNAVNALFERDYRTHYVDTEGHSDGCYCPVVPGLIVTQENIQNYKDTFRDWEVVYVSNASPELQSFKQNKRKVNWWVKGEELNDDFAEFVEKWMNDWVGSVFETVFDVNILMIDSRNAAVNGYNDRVFKAMERHGVTPHIVNLRHRFFWDGGLHCLTQDLHREGQRLDFFPERN